MADPVPTLDAQEPPPEGGGRVEKKKHLSNDDRSRILHSLLAKSDGSQNLNFGAVSQPYYVLLSPDLEVLAPPVQNTDAETYRNWLQEGLRVLEADAFQTNRSYSITQ